MARPRKFTDEQFMTAYRAAEDMDDLALRLNCSRITTYLHCTRLEILPVQRSMKDYPECLAIIDHFKDKVSLKEMSEQLKISRSTLRMKMKRAIEVIWQFRSWPEGVKKTSLHKRLVRYSYPKKLSHFKIARLLTEHEELFDDPDAIAESTDINETEVQAYLSRCFDKLQTRANKTNTG